MAATGFHNKVERVFLVMHIGFVGVYSGNVHRGFFLYKRGVFWYSWGVLVHFGVFFVLLGVFWYKMGGFFGTSRGVFLVGTTKRQG